MTYDYTKGNGYRQPQKQNSADALTPNVNIDDDNKDLEASDAGWPIPSSAIICNKYSVIMPAGLNIRHQADLTADVVNVAEFKSVLSCSETDNVEWVSVVENGEIIGYCKVEFLELVE